jgi:lipopolysaccharide/colanic/teichoic acid biosynthesis glycosyltransferase
MKTPRRPPDPSTNWPAASWRNRLRAWRARLIWSWLARRHGWLKRGLDLAVVLPAILLLSPLLLVVALAVRLQDGGPALYWQRRVGLNGRVFPFPKFRSMRRDADALRAQLLAANQHGADGVTFKVRRDPRVTPVGRLIRRTSIDELPQLWCVLVGDMSLVGPRPPLESEVARYSLADRERLSVMPGLTCIWQVSGRSEIPFPQQVAMDLEYIRRPGLTHDLRLLARTLPAVVRGRGAY